MCKGVPNWIQNNRRKKLFMSADRDSYTTRVMKMGPGHLQSCMEINHTTKQTPNRSGENYSKKIQKPTITRKIRYVKLEKKLQIRIPTRLVIGWGQSWSWDFGGKNKQKDIVACYDEQSSRGRELMGSLEGAGEGPHKKAEVAPGHLWCQATHEKEPIIIGTGKKLERQELSSYFTKKPWTRNKIQRVIHMQIRWNPCELEMSQTNEIIPNATPR